MYYGRVVSKFLWDAGTTLDRTSSLGPSEARATFLVVRCVLAALMIRNKYRLILFIQSLRSEGKIVGRLLRQNQLRPCA
eukprot:6186333-Pleurochrysis_carterae.AAC.1